MQTEQGRILVCIWREALKVEGAVGISNAFGERFELLAL